VQVGGKREQLLTKKVSQNLFVQRSAAEDEKRKEPGT